MNASPIEDVKDINNEFSLLCGFLSDCNSLGQVRLVVVGSGAILETVGSFENLRFADTVKVYKYIGVCIYIYIYVYIYI
jgi:hypothetical protein